jgi:hypothetical protein
LETEIKTQEGMVAFLDILGYSSFLQNNEPEEAAKTVRNHLLNAPENTKKVFEQLYKDPTATVVKKHVDSFRWLIFSDTILLTNSYQPEDSQKTKALRWLMFLMTLATLYRNLFCNGLPIRGAVSYGKYFVEEHCFAGRSIIGAYQLSNSLNLAGIVLDRKSVKEAFETLEVTRHYPKVTALLVLEYLVPLKNQDPQSMHVLSPMFPQTPRLQLSDIRQGVAECFWKHKKDLRPEVLEKIHNTEFFFRFAKMTDPKMFEKGCEIIQPRS